MIVHVRGQKGAGGLENPFAGGLLHLLRTPLAQADGDVDKPVLRVAIGDRNMIGAKGAHADAGGGEAVHTGGGGAHRLAQGGNIAGAEEAGVEADPSLVPEQEPESAVPGAPGAGAPPVEDVTA